MLVLADVYDAEGLVRDVLTDWARGSGARVIGGPAHGTPFELRFDDPSVSRAARALDLGDFVGEMHATVWLLYAGWDPTLGLSFGSYASGILRKRVKSYVRDNLGSTELYRSNGRSLVRVYPKAHAPAVCVSIDGLTDERNDDGDTDRGGSDRVDFSLGTVTRDFADDRSFDLARALNG